MELLQLKIFSGTGTQPAFIQNCGKAAHCPAIFKPDFIAAGNGTGNSSVRQNRKTDCAESIRNDLSQIC